MSEFSSKDWLGDEDKKDSSRTVKRVILTVLLILSLVASGTVIHLILNTDKDEAQTGGDFISETEDKRKQEEAIAQLQDPTHEIPTAEQIQQAEDFAGVEFLEEANANGIDPREQILGVYGVNVPIAKDVQEAFGSQAATIATSGLRTYEQLWGAFELAGAHNDIYADGVLLEIQANTDNILDEQVWNSLAKMSGRIRGEPAQWNGGKDCFLNALGGASSGGKLLCTTGDFTTGNGQWYMQLNAPKIDWAGRSDVQGGVKMTLIRQMFIPSSQEGNTIIAATPIVLYMQPSSAQGALYDWSLVSIDYGETVAEVVAGTYQEVAQGL